MAKAAKSQGSQAVEHVNAEVVEDTPKPLVEGLDPALLKQYGDLDATLDGIVQQEGKTAKLLHVLQHHLISVLRDYPDTTPSDLANHICGQLGYRYEEHKWQGSTVAEPLSWEGTPAVREMTKKSSQLYKLVGALRRKYMTTAVLLRQNTAQAVIQYKPTRSKAGKTVDSERARLLLSEAKKLAEDRTSFVDELGELLEQYGIVVEAQERVTVVAVVKQK